MKREEEIVLMSTLIQSTQNPIEALIDFQTIEDMLTLRSNEMLLNTTKRKKDLTVRGLLLQRMEKTIEQYKEFGLTLNHESQ